MKVNIGPYLKWWGPYQLADLLLYWNYIPGILENRVAEHYLNRVRFSEDQVHEIGRWLADTWVNDVCVWVHSKRKRRERVRIDYYDTWSMKNTLALIILPMLKQLDATKHGIPYTDDEDVPEGLNLRSTEAPPKKNEWDTDDNMQARWQWILNEMIWAFEQYTIDGEGDDQFFDHSAVDKSASIPAQISQIKCDNDGYTAHWERIARGTQLFGKYYGTLWD